LFKDKPWEDAQQTANGLIVDNWEGFASC